MRGQLQPGAPPAAGCPQSLESRRGRRARREAPGCTSAPPGRHPAPRSWPLQPRQRRLRPPGPQAAFAHGCRGISAPHHTQKMPAGVFLGAKGLIIVRHSQDDLCSSGWSVKKANPSEFSYRPRETPSDPRPSRREEEGSARERGPAAAAAL